MISDPPALSARSDGARRRGVFGWMLFDWANQPFYTLVLTFIFAPYFTSQVIPDPVAGQAIWGAAAAAAGVAVALLSPVLGAIADGTGRRKAWVLAFSVPYVLGCLALWLAVPGMAAVWPVLLAFGLAYVGSELTILYTNAMLPDLGPREEIGRISGSGWALGFVGGLLSLLIMLALLVPAPGSPRTLIGIAPLFGLDPARGEPARAAGPLSALWYMVFVIPLFLWTRDMPRTSRRAGAAVRAGLGELAGALGTLRRARSLGFYLAASMIYRDALAAIFVFGGVYAAGVLGWGTFALGICGITAAGAGALGAYAGGRADRALGPKPVVVATIGALILTCLALFGITRSSVLGALVPPGSHLPDHAFLAAGALIAAAGGALQAASRTLLVHQAEGRMGPGQAFGLYALAGKATAFLGPSSVAFVTAWTGSQRLGVAPIIALFAIGLALLSFVKAEPSGTGPRTKAP